MDARARLYDLTFAKGGGWTSTHQMRIADKRSGITRTDLVDVAETFGIRDPRGIIHGIADVLARWPAYAKDQHVPEDTARRVQDELEGARPGPP